MKKLTVLVSALVFSMLITSCSIFSILKNIDTDETTTPNESIEDTSLVEGSTPVEESTPAETTTANTTIGETSTADGSEETQVETTGETSLEETGKKLTDSPVTEETGQGITPIEDGIITLLDNETCSWILSDMNPDNPKGFTFKATLVNKTKDIKLLFSIYDAYFNNLKNDPNFGTIVDAGQTLETEVIFPMEMITELKMDVTDILIDYWVFNRDEITEGSLGDGMMNIYPQGSKMASVYTRTPNQEDIVLVDNEHCTFTYIDNGIYQGKGYAINAYIENKSDLNLLFSADEVKVNGTACDPLFSETVFYDTSAYVQLQWDEETLLESGIASYNNIKTIEFVFNAVDDDNWVDTPIFSEDIVLEAGE